MASETNQSRILDATAPAPRRLLRIKQVTELTGLCVASIYNGMDRQEFPANFRGFGSRAVFWDAAEVEAWVRDRIAERRPSQRRRQPNLREAADAPAK